METVAATAEGVAGVAAGGVPLSVMGGGGGVSLSVMVKVCPPALPTV